MRAIVNVATGSYVKGQERLTEWCAAHQEDYVHFRNALPAYSPSHAEIPYAFKAHALANAAEQGYRTLLWCDACIIPVRPLKPLWERIERDGYWIGSQAGPEPDRGYSNYEWTADSAYPGLFPGVKLEIARALNRKIPHVVATCFGLSLAHPAGTQILHEYCRMAQQALAFCGPWTNKREAPCGPPDVRGHRHDQTALSVIADRMACTLTRWPDVFAYRGHETEKTIVVADGVY